MSAGTLLKLRISSSIESICSSSWPSIAALSLSTYVLWCLPWWISIVLASMCGSRAEWSYGRSGRL